MDVSVYGINRCKIGLHNKNKNILSGGWEFATKMRKIDRK